MTGVVPNIPKFHYYHMRTENFPLNLCNNVELTVVVRKSSLGDLSVHDVYMKAKNVPQINIGAIWFAKIHPQAMTVMDKAISDCQEKIKS